MQTEPLKQHQWLNQLIGEWIFDGECIMGPDQSPSRWKGHEVVRSLGGIWTIAEGNSEMPDGSLGQSITTLDFDPQKSCFLGTFIASMMTHLWLYKGSLDADEKILTLDTEGPNFSEGVIVPYQDIIEFISPDHRILTSRIKMEDGTWNQFMTAHYHRQK